MSYVKIFLWSIVAQEGTNILIFYTFEYGAECSAESGAKQYFISGFELFEEDFDRNWRLLIAGVCMRCEKF